MSMGRRLRPPGDGIFICLESTHTFMPPLCRSLKFACSQVVAQRLSLLILFMDMERDAGKSPYRVLASARQPERAIVLKRQG